MSDNETKHWLVRPRTIRGLWVVFALVLASVALADLLIHGHASFAIANTFAFNAWYGLLTCVAMVIVAKGLGVLLKRRDDYYND